MKNFWALFVAMFCVVLAACDLQPKIMSLPDSVGDFISSRYPALLADPVTQPDIYNSAASDYGVYASPELYGRGPSDDYVLYASVNDYIIPPEADNNSAASAVQIMPSAANENVATDTGDAIVYYSPDADARVTDATPAAGADAVADDYLRVPMYGGNQSQSMARVTVAKGDTLYSLSRRYNMSVDEIARLNDLKEPYNLTPGQQLKVGRVSSATMPETVSVRAPVAQSVQAPASKPAVVSTSKNATTTTRVELREVTVANGDTLYSISRKYSVPVNDLAVMNNLEAPFSLTVGQKIKVPNLASANVQMAAPTTVARATTATSGAGATSTSSKTTVAAKSASTPAQNVTNQTKAPAAAATKPKQKISSDPNKKLPTISARSSSKFSWPVRGTILSHYGAKNNGLFNDGINIGASRGVAVNAAENGVVAYAGNEVKGMGNLVIIQHEGGWMTVYAHMDSMVVRRGAKVSVGQKIGTVGATGKVDKPQLHFEIRKGTKAYNPANYLKK